MKCSYEILTSQTVLLYAAKHYNNPHCTSTEEFYDDFKRFKYIKRLVNKYIETGELKERLILNHIIVLNNIFGPEVFVRILFLLNSKYMEVLKPFLVLLNLMPDRIVNVKSEGVILSSDIGMDPQVVNALRNI